MERLPGLLLPWYETHKRDLPWRRDREPYHVWLSEIMLQQTRVEAVIGYYEAFLRTFPTVKALAEGSREVLLKLWEGLGYYSRARNLQKAALQIMEEGGTFPQTWEGLRKLPGVGPYTAGAISSICFEEPRAAVDGNVLRVLSRYRADPSPVTEPAVRKRLEEELSAVYPPGRCGDFTQSLMELGATVCLPNGKPRCEDCPLGELCQARALSRQLEFPVKAPKKPRRVEERTVFLLDLEGRMALCRRPEKGLLGGLWQFPDVEGTLTDREAVARAEEWGLRPTGVLRMSKRQHIFTHVQWELTGWWLTCAAPGDFTWVTPEELSEKISLPTAYRQFLEK